MSQSTRIPDLSQLVHLRYCKIDYSTPNNVFNLQVLPCLEELELLHCSLLENINIIQGCTKLRKLFISDANGVLNWEILKEAKQLVELEIGWIEKVDTKLILEALEAGGKQWILQDNKFLLLL